MGFFTKEKKQIAHPITDDMVTTAVIPFSHSYKMLRRDS
jgi:hypothetical protein